jgi:hypothetical protein
MRKGKLGRQVAQALWWIGLVMMVVGISMAVLRFGAPGYILLGGGFVAFGLNALIGGELIAGPEPRPFTARGTVVRGFLEAKTGLCDLSVGVCGSDRIAAVQYGPLGKPGFEVRDGVAHLRLVQAAFQPNVTTWRADLANNVLWDIEAGSFLGDLSLDLSNLRLEEVRARTSLGYLNIVCPTRGYARMNVRSSLGEIEINIPPQVGAKLVIKRGALATVTIQNERLQPVKRNRYTTSDFDTATAQVEIQIETAAGDVVLT